jgi:hypothetical protein
LSKSKIIESIEQEIEMEGHAPGTPAFEHRVDQMKVIKCREYRGHFVCTDCDYFDHCELIKKVMRYSRTKTTE